MNSNHKILLAMSIVTPILILCVAIVAPHIGQEATPLPQIHPVSNFTKEGRVIPPPKPPPAPVDEKIANVELHSTPPLEVDFELPKASSSPAISIPKDAPRDNTTPIPLPSQNTASVTASEPKMGDTRTVDGQKQVYFLGFGWIEDNDKPNVGIVVDGEGDINKIVGTMD